MKELRLKLLQLHKLFVDAERGNFENQNGRISSGQFLNLIVNDSSFQWLRKFSILIVEIDEMFDLDDGFTAEMIERYISQIRSLINHESVDAEFINKYNRLLENNSEIAVKHRELENLLA